MIKFLFASDLFFILGVICGIFVTRASAEQVSEPANGKHKPRKGFYWDYDHQHFWHGSCNKGKLQSPIALDFKYVEEKHFPPFNFSNALKPYALKFTFANLTISINFESGSTGSDPDFDEPDEPDPDKPDPEVPQAPNGPYFNGGGYSGTYIFDHLDFHWNSEHTINKYRHPFEIHLVHYKSEYKNITGAKNYGDGIAILSTMFDLSPDNDTVLNMMILDVMAVCHFHKPPVTSKYQLTYRHFIPRNTAGYFRYHGSLTTPPCQEAVIWTVFTNTVPISLNQLKVFQDCRQYWSYVDKNNRQIQDTNDRTVYVKTSPIMYSHTENFKADIFSMMLFVYFLESFF